MNIYDIVFNSYKEHTSFHSYNPILLLSLPGRRDDKSCTKISPSRGEHLTRGANPPLYICISEGLRWCLLPSFYANFVGRIVSNNLRTMRVFVPVEKNLCLNLKLRIWSKKILEINLSSVYPVSFRKKCVRSLFIYQVTKSSLSVHHKKICVYQCGIIS